MLTGTLSPKGPEGMGERKGIQFFDLVAVLDFVEAIGRALLPTANGFSLLHTKYRHRSAILNERALTIRAHPILHLDPLQLDILLR